MSLVSKLVLQTIVKDLYQEIYSVFDLNGLSDSDLKKEVQIQLEMSTDPVITILLDNYVEFIEQGRKPNTGKIPPISELKDWAERKGLPTTNDVLYAIANAIRRDGIQGRPVLSMILDRIDKYFDEVTLSKIVDSMIEELFTDVMV